MILESLLEAGNRSDNLRSFDPTGHSVSHSPVTDFATSLVDVVELSTTDPIEGPRQVLFTDADFIHQVLIQPTQIADFPKLVSFLESNQYMNSILCYYTH